MLKLDLQPKPAVLQQFAWFAVLGLPLITFAVLKFAGLWSWSESWTHPAMLTAYGVGAGQLGLFLAGLRQPSSWIYAGLMLVAFPIGFVLSHVLMAMIFYLVFTPIGLVFRLIGRDAMGKSFDRSRSSYWHERGKPRSKASYFQLY